MPRYLVSHTIEFEVEAEHATEAEDRSFFYLIDAVNLPTGPKELTTWDVDIKEEI